MILKPYIVDVIQPENGFGLYSRDGSHPQRRNMPTSMLVTS